MSFLKLTAQNSGERTILSDYEFSSPLKIAKPFYDNERTKVMMMVASAGFFSGDEYNIEIRAEKNSSLEFTGQSFTKIFASENDRTAIQTTKIEVCENAKLFYFPPPIIPFAKSIYSSKTEIHLAKKCSFMLCEIISCGRTASGEKFAFQSYRSRTKIFVENELAFLDNTRLVPNEFMPEGLGFFEGFTHAALVYAYGFDENSFDKNENAENPKIELAFSKAKRGNFFRILANSVDEIQKFVDAIN